MRWRTVAICLVLAVAAACATPHRFHGIAETPPRQAPDLALLDQTGRPFRLEAFRGQVVLVYFGYTACPDVCPTTLAQLTEVRRRLGPDAARMQVVFVTVDPERDTPEVIQRYLAAFDPSYLGLRGGAAELAPVLQRYQVTATKRALSNSALGYSVDHTAFTVVIDGAGWLRERLPYGAPIEDVLDDVQYLLRSAGAR